MIHPLWSFCILFRIALIVGAYYLNPKIITIILTIIGLGFLFKSIQGSNDEIQITKVFWHETRIIHSMFYLLAAFYSFQFSKKLVMILLSLDLLFSIIYRSI